MIPSRKDRVRVRLPGVGNVVVVLVLVPVPVAPVPPNQPIPSIVFFLEEFVIGKVPRVLMRRALGDLGEAGFVELELFNQKLVNDALRSPTWRRERFDTAFVRERSSTAQNFSLFGKNTMEFPWIRISVA